MIKILSSAVLIAISLNSFSQNINNRKPWEDWKKKQAERDELSKVLSLPGQSLKTPQTIETNPSVVRLELKGKYTGNNKAGSDIYAMQPDKMPCLIPDSTFASNMPIALRRRQNVNLNDNLGDGYDLQPNDLREMLLKKKKMGETQK